MNLFDEFDCNEYDKVDLVRSMAALSEEDIDQLSGMRFYYVYRILNLINDHFYIGVHGGENGKLLDDEYMGSGGRILAAIRKYGAASFKKEILIIADSEEQAFGYEAQIVTQELVDSDECYNCTLGGKGGWNHINSGPNSRYYKRLANKIALENGNHVFQRPGHQSEAGKHSKDNMTHQQCSDSVRKAALTRGHIKNSELAKKSVRTQKEKYGKLPMNGPESTAKRKATMRVKWVFYNPSKDEYKVHDLYWKYRLIGYTKKLCKYCDWSEYCLGNDIDPSLIGEVTN